MLLRCWWVGRKERIQGNPGLYDSRAGMRRVRKIRQEIEAKIVFWNLTFQS